MPSKSTLQSRIVANMFGWFILKLGDCFGDEEIGKGSAKAGAQKAPHAGEDSPPQEIVFIRVACLAARFSGRAMYPPRVGGCSAKRFTIAGCDPSRVVLSNCTIIRWFRRQCSSTTG